MHMQGAFSKLQLTDTQLPFLPCKGLYAFFRLAHTFRSLQMRFSRLCVEVESRIVTAVPPENGHQQREGPARLADCDRKAAGLLGAPGA